MRVLVTGGAGFIGHHLIEALLKNSNWSIVSLDRLDTSGTLARLTDLDVWERERERVTIVHHDLKAAINDHVSQRIGSVDVVLHLAASSHVDRSIIDPLSFVMDNVVGTCNLLNWCRSGLNWNRSFTDARFVYFGTDEVFGPAPGDIQYKEWDRYKPGNPYAATKSGAEDLCIAFQNTYQLPVIIVHCMNVFGERQCPEKFLPSVIRKVLRGEKVSIHSDAGKTKAGSRFYIHARNVIRAVLFLLNRGEVGEKYNIVGEQEVSNLDLALTVARHLKKPLDYELVDFHSSRPGHDLRYALDGSKMAELGWKLPVNFESSLRKTIEWYVKHPHWL